MAHEMKIGQKTMMVHASLRCTKDTLSIYFGQCQWNMIYAFTVESLICITVYHILGNDKEQGGTSFKTLNKFHIWGFPINVLELRS